VQWLGWKCGMGAVTAHEHVRVARALRGLPLLAAEMGAGWLSWSKVRDITRVATVESQQDWINVAKSATAGHVRRIVSSMVRVSADDVVSQYEKRGLRHKRAEDGSWVFELRLPGLEGDMFLTALNDLAKFEKFVLASSSLADALVAQVVDQNEPVRAEIVINVDVERLGGGEGVCATDNGHPVAVEELDAVGCDATITTVTRVNGKVAKIRRDRRRLASARQRRWLRQYQRSCVFPGCHHSANLDVHHLLDHSKGGRTVLRNLGRLCRRHHTMVHVNGWELHRDPGGVIVVVDRDGRTVRRTIEPVDIEFPEPEGTLEPLWWYGDKLDLDLAVLGFLERPQPQPAT
jgi:hypothetical protein